jgi:hypothetical protein
MQAIEDTEKWVGSPEVLQTYFPNKTEKLEDAKTDGPLPNTSKWDFDKAIRKQKRGMRAAPCGKRMGHMIQSNIKPSKDEDGDLCVKGP